AAEADQPGGAGPVPGDGAVGLQPGGPGQPAAGRLRPAGPAAGGAGGGAGPGGGGAGGGGGGGGGARGGGRGGGGRGARRGGRPGACGGGGGGGLGGGWWGRVEGWGEKAAQVWGFAGEQEGKRVVGAAGVRVVGLVGGGEVAPVGEAAWGATWLPLPGERA